MKKLGGHEFKGGWQTQRRWKRSHSQKHGGYRPSTYTLTSSTSVNGMELRLTELKDGESGVVTSIEAGHGRHHGERHGTGRGWGFRKRLEDMGLTPGTRVTVIKSAPFHGPLEVYVRGSRLAIGKGMAERIFIEATR